jgi:hypothetical protein
MSLYNMYYIWLVARFKPKNKEGCKGNHVKYDFSYRRLLNSVSIFQSLHC